LGNLVRNTGYLASLYWLLVLPFLVLGSLILLVSFVSGLLFPAAVGVDRSDAFEAISRCFSYFLARPFQFALLFLLMFVASGFISALVDLVLYGAQWWVAQGSSPDGGISVVSPLDQLVREFLPQTEFGDFWLWPSIPPEDLPYAVLQMFGNAIRLSLLFSLSTAVYLLLRKSKDGAPLDKIFVEGEGRLQEIKTH